MKPILITGVAGFIGFHLAKRCLDEGMSVVGVDNVNDYYDVSLKNDRLDQLSPREGFTFHKLELADRGAVEDLFEARPFASVVHLGAQAGVRYSLTNPHVYVKSNIEGFLHVLEGCRRHPVEHLVYASSSSVYGAITQMPFSVKQNVDHPVSLYAATKKSNELFAHCYSHLYGIPCTGLRFFTVYGPWGRPDMALFLFTQAILAGEPIKVFAEGQMMRDFTYIDDVVEGIYRVMGKAAQGRLDWNSNAPHPGTSAAPYQVYNIGNHQPVQLLYLIEVLERCLGRTARKEFLPLQPGDVPATYADVSELAAAVDFAPRTPIEVGVERFVSWYRDHYAV